MEYYCNKADQAWDWRSLPRGTACDDGKACTSSDACDSNGNCAGTPILCIFNPPGPITGPSSSSTGTFTLSWSAPSTAGTIASYELYQNGSLANSLGSNQRSVTLSRGDGSYSFVVRACDAIGCGPFTSPAFNVTVLLTPATPTIAGPSMSLSGSYTISWSPAPGYKIAGYKLERQSATEAWRTLYTGTGTAYAEQIANDATYWYRVSAFNASGSSPPTNPLAVTVNRHLTTATPDAPLVAVNPPDQQWLGTLAGAPGVEGGAASYRIPIEVPPGRAGMQPDVALTYNSRKGNGVAGVGWSLSVTSSIYRCPRTLDQDGGSRPVMHDDQDRLCYDGKRLIPDAGMATGASGSTYRTEIDSFDRVTLLNGTWNSWDAYFEVAHKDGRISHFSAISKTSSVPDTWYLVDEADRQNNCIRYDYIAWVTAGQRSDWLLTSITYTGTMSTGSPPRCMPESTSRMVGFNYSERDDRRSGYSYGVYSSMTKRLSEIMTWAPQAPQSPTGSPGASRPVRRYEFSYKLSNVTQRSLLESAVVCAPVLTGSGRWSCGSQLPRTTFSYQEPPLSSSFQNRVRFAPDLGGGASALGASYTVKKGGDFDGDGMPDMLFANSSTGARYLQLSSCSSVLSVSGGAAVLSAGAGRLTAGLRPVVRGRAPKLGRHERRRTGGHAGDVQWLSRPGQLLLRRRLVH